MLIGQASVEAYQATLRSITYSDPSYDPTITPRTAQITVTDSQSQEATASRSIFMTAVNDPPGVRTPPIQSTDTETPIVFSNSGGNAILISDVDGNGFPEQVTLLATGGTLRLASSEALNLSGTDTAITLFAPLQSINAALDGLTFTPASPYATTASIEVSADDLGNSGIGGAQIVNALIPINITGPAAIPPLISSTSPSPRVGASDPAPSAPPLPPNPPIDTPAPPPANATPAESVRTVVEAKSIPFPPATIAAQFAPARTAFAASLPTSTDGDTVQRTELSSQGSIATDAESSTPMAVSNGHRAIGHPYAASLVSRLRSGFGEPADTASQVACATVTSQALSKSFSFATESPFLSPARTRITCWQHADTWRPSASGLLGDLATAGQLAFVRTRLNSEIPLRVWAGGASVLSAGVSIAYLLWMARGGSVLSGVFSSIPPWQMLDPLPVLDGAGTARDLICDEREGLAELISDAAGT
jgi:hypothetical protein